MTTSHSSTMEVAPVATADLAAVVGGGVSSMLEVARDLPAALRKPVAETRAATIDFINSHSFFHQGLMDMPIGGGKHFRNVPFVGPTVAAFGALTGNGTAFARGVEVTRGTWAAP